MRYTVRRATAVLTLGILLTSLTITNAAADGAANKSALLQRIDSLTTSVNAAIQTESQSLLSSASSLGDLYDTRLRIAGLDAQDVAGLRSIGALSDSGTFRDEVMGEYTRLSSTLFTGINQTVGTLSNLRLQISLGTSDVTDAQYTTYGQTLAGIESGIATFQSGATASITTFSTTERQHLDARISTIATRAQTSGSALALFRSARTKYAQVESGLTELQGLIGKVDNNVLQSLQNNLTFLQDTKNTYRTNLETNITNVINQASTLSPRVAAQKSYLQTVKDGLLGEWDDSMTRNFSDDSNLLLAFMKAQNNVKYESDLRSRIYDQSGGIRYADLYASGALTAQIDAITSDIAASTGTLNALLTRYASVSVPSSGSGSVRDALQAKLRNAYESAFADYQSRLVDTIQKVNSDATLTETNTALANKTKQLSTTTQNLLSEKATLTKTQLQAITHALTAEKKLLDSDLRKSLSVGFAQKRVKTFIQTVTALTKDSTGAIRMQGERLQFAALTKLYTREISAYNKPDATVSDDEKAAALTIDDLVNAAAKGANLRTTLKGRLARNITLAKDAKTSVASRYELTLENHEISARLAK